MPAPQFSPTPRELDDLELLINGALPGARFNAPDSPVTLMLPPTVEEAALAAGAVELVDPEGLPLATVTWPAGEVTALSAAAYGPFRRLYLSPAQVREQYAGRTVVPITGPLTHGQLDALSEVGPVLLLALVGAGTPALSPVATLRATLRAAGHLADAVVVAVPLASHGDDAALRAQVVTAYAGQDPVTEVEAPDAGGRAARPATAERAETGADDYPADIAEVIAFDRPARDRQGLVLFFTGLSGSGKSTLARALMDRLLEAGERTVTSLDGDVVRRNLSAGLTFSKEDRETNIRRIGWVAAEISRHGGVAVCSPIAPFDATRQDVRRYVADAGGAFFLVHVATPLEECERRDRKGLYAKARAGEIPEFTGISSPYEEPRDADVRVDTTGRTIEDALEDVLVALRDAGYVDLTAGSGLGTPSLVPRDDGSTSVGPEVEPADEGGRAETGTPLNVLFVCTANICRSAYLQVRAEALGLPGLAFDSAGTHGWPEHPMDADMAATLPDGTDPGTFRSKPLTREVLERADLVLTAESAHRTFILDDHPAMFRMVFTLGQAAAALGRIEPTDDRAELLRRLADARGTADPASDVPDPYRRGPEAARACADRLDELLDQILGSLARTQDRR